MIKPQYAVTTLLVFAAGLLAGCASQQPGPAPLEVVDIQQVPDILVDEDAPLRPKTHIVSSGETLGEIALSYGLNYRDLALWNRIANIDLIEVGQQLRLYAPKGQAQVIPLKPVTPQKPIAISGADQPSTRRSGVTRTEVGIGDTTADNESRVSLPQAVKLPFTPANLERLSQQGGTAEQAVLTVPDETGAKPGNIRDQQGISWSWPVQGRLASKFSDTNRGIDIVGPRGQPVFASAGGTVIYAGTGLKGYGQLVIIKHPNEYLSTYAHNDKILVAEGETVQRGAQIAEMGDSGTDRVRLHFEIRRGEKTYDPQQFLPQNP